MPITGEQVAAHRKSLGMSRNKYAEHVGLTPTKIHNIEHGRAMRPEEEQLFSQFIAMGSEVPAATVATEGESVSHTPPPSPAPRSSLDEPAPDVILSGAPVPVVLLTDEEEEEAGDVEPEIPEGTSVTWGIADRYDFKLPGYHISNSELSCFKRCRRKWYLAYYRELRLKTPTLTGPRAIGTRIHIALSAYYSTRREEPMAVLEATIADDRRLLQEGTDVEALETLEKDVDLARAMLEGYLEWVSETGADEGLEVIADETVVEVPFDPCPGYALVGKMDLRLRRAMDGARLFLDHKTVGSLTQPLKTLHLDEQMLHYHLLEFLEFLQAGMSAEEAEREHAHGGLYNMIRRVKRTAQAKPPFFDRLEVRHNVHELRSYYQRVFGEITQIHLLRNDLNLGKDHREVAYPTPRGDCSWDCDFLAVCPMFDDGSAAEELLAEFYQQHDPHDHYYPYGEREDERTNA